MTIELAQRMKDYEAGIFQVLNEKKIEREKAGGKVFNFSVGTPDFEPPKHIIDALVEAAKIPANYKYSLIDIPELIDAVICRYSKRYGVSLEKDEIMSVYGSQEGITHIAFTFANPGDIVLVPDPGYPVFSIGPSLAGADLKPYKLYKEKGYLPDLSEIEKLYGKGSPKKAKAIIVSYPLNPVCKCAPDSFYEELIAWAKKNEILVIHDNAYSDIVYDGKIGKSFLAFEGAKEVGVEFYSLSKSFNYTGARMSFVVGNKDFVAAFKRLRSQIDYGIFLPVQYGAIAALTGPDDCVKEQCKEYEKRRNALCDGLTNIGWKFERSQGSMFAWTAIPEKYGKDDVRFVMELFEKTGVLCTPGSSFGSLGAGHVRFALVLPVPVIEEAVNIIASSGVLA
ncbi:MAG: aminotransferase class I/II-fold pyridoxal phosphate-dependent enzyme [Lachnospiraceae bacterium]|nr:aminotransferase class I/II-fold pyridoxal phosphate-dependent enzyme [Lachnospiraceae bacterium]